MKNMKGNVIGPQSTGQELGVVTEKGPASRLGPALVFAGFLLYLGVELIPSLFSRDIFPGLPLIKLVWPHILLSMLGLALSLRELIRKSTSDFSALLLLVFSIAVSIIKFLLVVEYYWMWSYKLTSLFGIYHKTFFVWMAPIVSLLLVFAAVFNFLAERKALRKARAVNPQDDSIPRLGLLMFAVGAFIYLDFYLKNAIAFHGGMQFLSPKLYYTTLLLVFASIVLFRPRHSLDIATKLLFLSLGWIVLELGDLAAGILYFMNITEIASFHFVLNGGALTSWASDLVIVAGGLLGFVYMRRKVKKEQPNNAQAAAGHQPLPFILILSGLVLFFSARMLPAFYVEGHPAINFIQALGRIPGYVIYLYLAAGALGLALLAALLFSRRRVIWISAGFIPVALGFLWVVIGIWIGPLWLRGSASASVGLFVPLTASLALLAGAILGLVLKKPREASP